MNKIQVESAWILREIAELLRKNAVQGLSVEENGDLLNKYDTLVEHLYRSRSESPLDHADLKRIEDGVATIGFELATIGGRPIQKGWYQTFILRYRAVWRAELSLFLFALLFFLLSGVTGWNIAVSFPEYVPVILPQGALENIIEHHAWFQDLQENPILGGIQIAWNNIRVTVYCFLAGALLGVGGLLMLCFNGLFFGAILGYCYVNGFHQQLTDFVLGHGPLELSVIIAAGFASLVYGRAFFQRPLRQFPHRFRIYARSAGLLALGITPWLIIAATIEAFVSPFNYLSTIQKLALGSALASCFWGWNLWGILRYRDTSTISVTSREPL